MTSIKSFVSLNRPWAYIFWSDHEFVIALNFHVLYWWSLHCTTAYNAAFLLILTFLKLIRLIAPSFVWFIHSFMSFIHAFVRSFCSSSGGSSEKARTSHPPPPLAPPIRPNAVRDWNSYIITTLFWKRSRKIDEKFSWQFKTESIRKLSDFNFQWTKILYQNNLSSIAFCFTFFNG